MAEVIEITPTLAGQRRLRLNRPVLSFRRLGSSAFSQFEVRATPAIALGIHG